LSSLLRKFTPTIRLWFWFARRPFVKRDVLWQQQQQEDDD
jgi:hypothetical protein